MNALEAASLVMIPSGYEDGTLGSLKPTNGNGDFTFSRGSNISATRVNADGNIEKGYENLLLQSNQFDTSPWSISSGASIVGNQSGYDGSNDAWLLSKTDSSKYLNQNATINGLQTFSFYAKAGNSNFVWIKFFTGGHRVTFDLQNGIAVGLSNAIDAKIESVSGANNWYRCSLTADFNANFFRIYPAEGDSIIDGTSGSIYIQDAMVNQGLVAYPYVETTTAPVAGGILEDMPRLDYSGSCPALLLEPERTNLIRYSEWIGSWSLQNISVSIDDTISPEGYANVSKLTAPSTGFTRASQQLTFIAGTTYTFSAWIKNINATTINFVWYDVANQIFIDLVDNVNTESFTRVSISFTPTNTSSSSQVQIARGLPTGQSFYIYGLQVEQDATYPTSYIPTYGVSQTRLGDVLGNSNNISGLFNDNKGTLYFETDDTIFKGETNNYNFFGLTESSSGGYFRFRGADSTILAQSGGFGSTISFNPNGATFTKYLYKWDGTNIKIFIDGVERGSVSQTATFNPDLFRIGFNFGFVSNTKQFLLFPTALSDEACIELTTI